MGPPQLSQTFAYRETGDVPPLALCDGARMQGSQQPAQAGPESGLFLLLESSMQRHGRVGA